MSGRPCTTPTGGKASPKPGRCVPRDGGCPGSRIQQRLLPLLLDPQRARSHCDAREGATRTDRQPGAGGLSPTGNLPRAAAPAPQREEARASLANTQSVTGKCRCDSSTDLGVGRQDPTSSPFPPLTGLEAVSREARVHQGLDSCLRPSHPADGTSVPQALILPVTTARFAGGFRGREGVPSREPVPVPTGHTCPRSGPYSAHSDLG